MKPLRGVGLALLLLACSAEEPSRENLAVEVDRDAYAGSGVCDDCHPDQSASWRRSHHAQAERKLDPAQDRVAFDPAHEFERGEQRIQVGIAEDGGYQWTAPGADGETRSHRVVRAFGVDPMRQYLIDVGAGRLQVSEFAYDPKRAEWFDVFGEEVREPGDWGHWSGRGMNWNSRCAECHNTGVRQGYDAKSDRYTTRLEEWGVGCEACHGPAADHVAWHRKEGTHSLGDPLAKRGLARNRDRIVDGCAQCHSRRTALSESFRPGDLFLDHFVPAYPDERPLYYPDGQVRDEDFVYGSFLGSGKASQGVSCVGCHEPHSGALRVEGNALCLGCHQAQPDFVPHSHHEPGTEGDGCVDCHMPATVYMERDSRRDHLFSLPDPQLTIDLEIPNACNRCHENETPAWALEWTERWYDSNMLETRRSEVRVIAAARRGDPEVVSELIDLSKSANRMLRRASATRLLGTLAPEPAILERLAETAGDPEPMIRLATASALSMLVTSAQPVVTPLLLGLGRDPIRAVRVESSRGLTGQHDPSAREMRELRQAIDLRLGQPSGEAELGSWLHTRGKLEQAHWHFVRGAEWDPQGATLQRMKGLSLAALGRLDEALPSLERARRLDPDDPLLRFQLALALGETGRNDEAIDEFHTALRLAPEFTRAWYNLGLALRNQGELEAAVEALSRAAELDPLLAAAPYARALILKDLGRKSEAREAAQEVLRIDPQDTSARALLAALEAGE